MNQAEFDERARWYFPHLPRDFFEGWIGKRIRSRLLEVPQAPLSLGHLNQLLHLAHQAGVSEGFFRYYFLESPARHPYDIASLLGETPGIAERVVLTLDQLRWGLHRLFVDGLLYFGNLRSAYRHLRTLSYDSLAEFFGKRRLDSERLRDRGDMMPLEDIAVDNRYLISEMACKVYGLPETGDRPIAALLLSQYKKRGGGKIRIKDLLQDIEKGDARNPSQLSLEFGADEFINDEVESEAAINAKIADVAARFDEARARAVRNTDVYLSVVNDLDVYVATSMREREDFRNMGRNCRELFDPEKNLQQRFRLRYFDPTMSAAPGHEDKGLIECLMVKCAKALVYFAGEKDSFGKDAEAAMALSLGKPVVIYCPPSPKGEERAKFFREVHPLTRLVNMTSGVPVGAMITSDLGMVSALLEDIFDNKLRYELTHAGDGYFRLLERRTRSVVRLQTNYVMLRESYWNYYHGVN